MFHKVLIANRGEIAVRILRACRELGVQTVAVYSEADRRALHVRYADQAYPIGAALARESYLNISHILDAARKSGAEAVHPGYGFLAENPEFAAACTEAGLTFIGPPAGAIAAMGDKVAARQLMARAGVPIIPGTETDLRDPEILARAAHIGFPLFIKAAAGGGGKGMRLVLAQDDLERALGAARREALKAFGDDRVYLEKAILGARHVEIQVLADTRGHVIHLGERECSIQRRHQKLVEESPSPAVEENLRQRMGRVAVQAAEAVGYTNAGTVEFILDHEGNFYFLEMNTRLQVEHPITESVTGLDLVQEQLRLATGQPLRYQQEDIQVRGWAIECRITAEDPFNRFLPVSGRVLRLYQPSGPGIRVDNGIYEGFEVSLYYDPLLTKLIAWGSSRDEAVRRMRGALREYRIVGLPTSIPFHRWVMDDARFLAGAYDTSFLEADFSLADPGRGEHRQLAAIVAAFLSHQQREHARTALSSRDDVDGTGGWRPDKGWKLAGRWEALGR
ncbi:MAG TPA: acetyl-CoA carboxylase biotin carboxylase subunit [Anaerolineae bacterium]|nr:acetyl-CoA carboxylase biotin carboxylase subunit [Anaerolineae bacterium]